MSPDCNENPLCPPRKRGCSGKPVRILLAWGMLMLPKKNQSAISNFAVNLKIKVHQLKKKLPLK